MCNSADKFQILLLHIFSHFFVPLAFVSRITHTGIQWEQLMHLSCDKKLEHIWNFDTTITATHLQNAPQLQIEFF
jgi:hypothetical protein